ncbi:MAG: hypothetical protein ACOX68_07855 [Candidatus Limivicinus sp.]|jgi:hypothetical protein
MASSKNADGAWRFVKTLMLGDPSPELCDGIPVTKASFERALEVRKNSEDFGDDYDNFNQYDAELMRYLVYNSRGLVRRDKALIDIFRAEINAYLGGKGTAEDCAGQLQSRVSIYMAEHS